jgi:hypothetical protein
MSRAKVKSAVVGLVVSAGMLASETALFGTSANADPYRHRGSGYSRNEPRYFDHRRYTEPRHYGRRDHHRDRRGDAVAATVLGLGALIVGAAVADAARRNRHAPRYEGHDD